MTRSLALSTLLSLLLSNGAGCGSKPIDLGGNPSTSDSDNTSVEVPNSKRLPNVSDASDSKVPDFVAAVDSEGEPVLDSEGEPLFVPNPDKPATQSETNQDSKNPPLTGTVDKPKDELPTDPDERPEPIEIGDIETAADLCEAYGIRNELCTDQSKLAAEDFCEANIEQTSSVECSTERINQFICLSNLSCTEMKVGGSCIEERVHSQAVCNLNDYIGDISICEDLVIRNNKCDPQTDDAIEVALWDCVEYAFYDSDFFGDEGEPGRSGDEGFGSCDLLPVVSCLSKLDCTGLEAETGCDKEVNTFINKCDEYADETPQVCKDISSRRMHCGQFDDVGWDYEECMYTFEDAQDVLDPDTCTKAYDAYFDCAIDNGNCENGYPLENAKCEALQDTIELSCVSDYGNSDFTSF